MQRLTRFLSEALVLALLVYAVVAALPARAQTTANGASAEIKDSQGQTVGNATFTTLGPGEVRLQVQLRSFSSAAAGEHGIHIHAVGVCEPPDFKSAGGHFNPTGQQHGLQNPAGPHAGDLPNLQLAADGSASYEMTTDRITLGAGERSAFDADGSALVIHAGPDDMVSDPAGNSGDRIACGVISPAAGLPATGSTGQAMAWWLALGAALLVIGLFLARVQHERNV